MQMLTRLYIHNFRRFVNFEYRPTRRQLIMGQNGAGKSSLMDALRLVRRFVVVGGSVDELFPRGQWTRWVNQPQQIFEVGANLDGATYLYRVAIESWGSNPPRLRIASETVSVDGKPIFEFIAGEVHLYNDQFDHNLGIGGAGGSS